MKHGEEKAEGRNWLFLYVWRGEKVVWSFFAPKTVDAGNAYQVKYRLCCGVGSERNDSLERGRGKRGAGLEWAFVDGGG